MLLIPIVPINLQGEQVQFMARIDQSFIASFCIVNNVAYHYGKSMSIIKSSVSININFLASYL